MKCHEARFLMHLCLDAEATGQQQAKLNEHLKDCVKCRSEYALARQTHEVLLKHCTLEEKVPDNFRESIMAKIDFNKPVVGHPHTKQAKRKKWNFSLGAGLLAGALGLFFTYMWHADSINQQLAQNNLTSKNSSQMTVKEQAQKQLAELVKPNNASVAPTLPAAKEVPAGQTKNYTQGNAKPKNETPVKVPEKMPKQIAELSPHKEAVDLPKPLAVTNLAYGQSQESTNQNTLAKPLMNLILTLPGLAENVNYSEHKFLLVTTNDGTAKLWQVDTGQNVKAQELDSQTINNVIPYAKSGKLNTISASDIAVTAAGQLAAADYKDGQSTLAAFGKTAVMPGKISKISWAPSENKVIYFLENGKLGHLESFDGQTRMQLTPDMPVQRIAWCFLSDDKMLLNILTDTPAIWELELGSAKFKPLTDLGGGKCIAANKNGDIAFTDANGKLYLLKSDKTSENRLLELSAQDMSTVHLTWQDNKTILATGIRQGATEIWKISLP